MLVSPLTLLALAETVIIVVSAGAFQPTTSYKQTSRREIIARARRVIAKRQIAPSGTPFARCAGATETTGIAYATFVGEAAYFDDPGYIIGTPQPGSDVQSCATQCSQTDDTSKTPKRRRVLNSHRGRLR
ncbi:hypothetical protein I316_07880 [Kwoniella heveanensis BCC8398]|uniref:Uncharacterized protein n=1 Tax=Kwoniella heveanensis BCC8398 TaxID=1296120 RepID=A0A1B9GHP9_9TREE|nr:hypothetical protein I316_07880 [Kwoniella heveanensis BCC8398]